MVFRNCLASRHPLLEQMSGMFVIPSQVRLQPRAHFAFLQLESAPTNCCPIKLADLPQVPRLCVFLQIGLPFFSSSSQ